MNQKIIAAKEAMVNEVTESIKNSQSTTIVEYRGLTVAQLTELRRELRKEGAELKVYKNNLVLRASRELGYTDLESSLEGPNAVVFSKESPTAAPKILAKFAKKNKALVIKSGIAEGKVLTKDQVNELAKLPSKEGMLSMLLGCLQSPVIKFACAVKAIAEKNEEQNA